MWTGEVGENDLKNEYAHIRKQLLTLSSSKMSFVPKLARLGKGERGRKRGRSSCAKTKRGPCSRSPIFRTVMDKPST